MADSNGDGVGDLAVGALYDDDGGTGKGAIYVLFMASTGVVKSFQKVSDTMGSFTGIIFLSFFLHEYPPKGVANNAMLHVGWIYVQAFWTILIGSASRCLQWPTPMVSVSATWQSGLFTMTMEVMIEAQSTSCFQVHIVVNKLIFEYVRRLCVVGLTTCTRLSN
jgi:hypothetical protein